jgi:Zn-finger nucleic acid-binding protein
MGVIMICPACGNELTEMDIGGTKVDACKGHCGGVWFDWFELKKVDEPFEAAGEVLLDIERDDVLEIDHSKRRTCPRCEGDVIMMRHFHSAKREVEVDECPKCAGFWLDAGELQMIREAFGSEEDKHKAADAYVQKFMKENYGKELEEMRENREKMEQFSKKFSNALRFLCPSYYIKGKQEGGAF